MSGNRQKQMVEHDLRLIVERIKGNRLTENLYCTTSDLRGDEHR